MQTPVTPIRTPRDLLSPHVVKCVFDDKKRALYFSRSPIPYPQKELSGSQIQNMKMTEVQGFKALEFLVKNDDIYFQGKLILVYNTLYQVFTVYKSKEDMTNNYVQFIDSFKILEPEKQRVAPKGDSSQKLNL